MPKSENYAHLSRSLKESRDRIATGTAAFEINTLDFLIGEFARLERIVNALESIGVNLDEEDIGALEGIAAGGACAGRDDIRQKFNGALASWQAESRELEQESAIEALARAGFVLDAEDGETWTRGNETAKITLVNGRESRYQWEYYKGHICERSGFRLLARLAIGPKTRTGEARQMRCTDHDAMTNARDTISRRYRVAFGLERPRKTSGTLSAITPRETQNPAPPIPFRLANALQGW